MNKMNRFNYPLIVFLSSIWWGWTILVDIFVIPTVFRTLEGFFEAGDLGIAVFSKLNNLEVIVSSILLALLALNTLRTRRARVPLILGVLLWMMAMTYFSWLTPKIIVLTEIWKNADQMNLTGTTGIPDIQQAHQFYHNLYIKLDMLKLTLLTAFIGLTFWKQEDFK